MGAAVVLLLAAAAGVVVARVVVVVAGIVDWRSDTAVTLVCVAGTTATTAFVLCRRSDARGGPTADRRGGRAGRVVQRASLTAGALLSAMLLPVTPNSWVQALPAGAFVALAGGGGVLLARARAR